MKTSEPTLEEIDYRTRLANCLALELKVERDRFELENKRGELCRIQTALNAFDGFLRELVGFLDSLPDVAQAIVPQMTPVQYKAMQELIETQRQRLSEHRLHLTIESNTAQQQANTAAKKERIARTNRRKKEADQ